MSKFESEKLDSLSEGYFSATLGDLSQKYIKQYADRLDLVRVKPFNDLSSTKYCLAAPDSEYLVFQPEQGEFTVDLSEVNGELMVEWFNPVNGKRIFDGYIKGGNRKHKFLPRFSPAVLYLWKQRRVEKI